MNANQKTTNLKSYNNYTPIPASSFLLEPVVHYTQLITTPHHDLPPSNQILTAEVTYAMS
jgi:hypothetical protein